MLPPPASPRPLPLVAAPLVDTTRGGAPGQRPPAVTPGARRRSPAATFANALLATFVVVPGASATCAVFSANWLSLAFFVFSAPVGALVGMVLAVPLAFVVATVLTRQSRSGQAIDDTCAPLEILFGSIALLVVVPLNAVMVWDQLTRSAPADWVGSTDRPLRVAGTIALAVLCIAATSVVSRAAAQCLVLWHTMFVGGRLQRPFPGSATVRAIRHPRGRTRRARRVRER